MDYSIRKRVLVTGASGRIATDFREYSAERYNLRLAAHHPEKLGDLEGFDIVPLELADPPSCAAA